MMETRYYVYELEGKELYLKELQWNVAISSPRSAKKESLLCGLPEQSNG